MANSKISALTSATTPLAGTEVLPIVQSSTTKQVSIANVTYGRDVSTRSILVRSDSGPTLYYGTISHDAVTTGANIYDVTSASGGGHVFRRGGSTLISIDAGGNIIPATAAKGVNFTANTPAAGMTSRLLNWYEEGTWTPTDQSGAGLSFTVTNSKYTRIGNVIHAYVYLTFPTTASTAIVKIGGLPFTVGSNVLSPSVISTNVGTIAALRTIPATTNMYLINPAANTDYTNSNMSTKFVVATLTYFI